MHILHSLLVLFGTSAVALGGPTVSVEPALGGAFRPGAPLALRVTVSDAAGFGGWLDVVAEGVAYRQPLRVGADGQASVEALVAVRSDQPRIDVVLRRGTGEEALRQSVSLALLGGERVAAVLGGDVQIGLDGLGEGWTVTAGEPPATWAGFLAVDVVFAASGSALPDGVWDALDAWVRAGGVLVLGANGGAGRWALAGGETKRLGLGAVVSTAPAAWRKAVWVDKGVWRSFPAAAWGTGERWRAAGGAMGLVVAGGLLAMAGVARGWRGAKLLALVVGLSAGLAWLGWGVMLPKGRGVAAVWTVVESVAGEGGERRTDVLCVSGVGRGRVRVALPGAAAVVPFYYSQDEAGSWRDVAIGREGDSWFVECEVTSGGRHCFGVLGGWDAGAPARRAGGDGDVLVRDGLCSAKPGGEWRALRLAEDVAPRDRAALAWQSRRTGRDGRRYRVAFAQGEGVGGDGLLSSRRKVIEWVELTDR